MYTSDTEKSLKTGMAYLAASVLIAAAAAVYGLFSHGVYSYFMTYAFMIPLLLGAVPHLAAALGKLRAAEKPEGNQAPAAEKIRGMIGEYCPADARTAVIAALTAGSLLKGALDIYGTTSRLLMAYPVIALLTAAAAALHTKRSKTKAPTEAAPELTE